MATFNGSLNVNKIFKSAELTGVLYNMIISQEVFADNVKGTDLVDQARVDGGLLGDTKLFYATDALESRVWGDPDSADTNNVLAPEARGTVKTQAISLDKFRQIGVRIDNYLTKQAFADEGTFSAFNSVMLGWLRDTKKVYDGTTYNCYIGTTTGAAKQSNRTVDGTDGKTIANGLADIITEMTDYNRDYNDYGFLRRYSEDEIKVIFNAKYINKITNVDLPVIFDNAGLKATFSKEKLPAKYFGAVNAEPTQGDGVKVRSLVEQKIGSNHYFAGDLIDVSDTAPAGTSYTQDDNIICKILVKLPPYMSAFEVGTSFFNPKSLTENHYLTFGHNTIEYLEAYPMVTVKKA